VHSIWQQQEQQQQQRGHQQHAVTINGDISNCNLDSGDGLMAQQYKHLQNSNCHPQEPQQLHRQSQQQLLPQLQAPPLPSPAARSQWQRMVPGQPPSAASVSDTAAAVGVDPMHGGAAAAAAAAAMAAAGTGAVMTGRGLQGDRQGKRERDGSVYMDTAGMAGAVGGGMGMPLGILTTAAEGMGPRPMKRYR
jgi:hypothetical protein